MPSRPRSEPELTARSSTVAWTAPLTTRRTRPVLFSRTRKSFGPRNAIVVGSTRPLTTVLTPKFVSGPSGVGCATASDGPPVATARAASSPAPHGAIPRQPACAPVPARAWIDFVGLGGIMGGLLGKERIAHQAD